MAKDLTKELEKMSVSDLTKLRAQVDKLITSVADREKKAALKAVEDAAKAHGFSLAELGVGSGKGKARAKAAAVKNPPKYRNPDDASQTWSGRGRRPQWVKDAEAAGATLDSLAI